MSTKNISIDFTRHPNSAASRSRGLPVMHELTLTYALSLIVAAIMTVASVAGILYQTVIYPADELLLSFIPSDIFNLALGVPILLGSTWLAKRGALIGLLSWPGALFYVLYMYIPYLIGVPFNVLFLPYLILVTLSAYTLIGLIESIDGEAVRQELAGSVPAKISAGILVGLAILIIVRQGTLIFTALTNETPVSTIELSSWIADFSVAIPALLVIGVTLWRGKTLGYVAGAGLLLGYGLLALSVIPFFVIEAHNTASPVDVSGVAAILVMAALCFISLAFFLRGAASSRRLSATN